ncbi:hypothetical protein AMTRI_Chr02g222450 [Amborella trichopoda]|uniref:C2 domain-containing protein n=1 Tax=Amborella trichopoda TaxID=13333 RepID=U5D431_AMBTC|nr:protein SRC2 homolog [Amborella trichopoda]XP_011627446.1 protein SRC2 homolog [Amborella trichopoda]XP_011627447.1 protein SRC2 homolog [Amborella trichopoda]ERN16990.1 hypothetical protein AMTR_s00057p00209740 [Amborella trichopoda]|eukprot:XP_006855523.1 protein SRC2 homolog [Amborella trichopoda]
MEYRHLDVTLVSAKDLKDVSFFGKMEVYAVAYLSTDPRTKHRTTIDHSGDRNPSWNFPVKFSVPEAAIQQGHAALQVTIRAEKALGDKDVGEVKIPLKELFSGEQNTAKTVTYQVLKPSGKPKGSLTFSYMFHPKMTTTPNAGYAPAGSGYPVAGNGYPVAGTAYPPAAKAESSPYPPPNSSSSSSSYPPQRKAEEPVMAYPANAAYPPPPQNYGYPPAPPANYYPAAGGYPQAGYPPAGQYGYPPQGAPPVYYQQPQKPKKSGMGGLGLGLGAGLLGGLLVGDMISDAGSYDGGFDDGGGFDF